VLTRHRLPATWQRSYRMAVRPDAPRRTQGLSGFASPPLYRWRRFVRHTVTVATATAHPSFLPNFRRERFYTHKAMQRHTPMVIAELVPVWACMDSDAALVGPDRPDIAYVRALLF
jgi:hypothetical protein